MKKDANKYRINEKIKIQIETQFVVKQSQTP